MVKKLIELPVIPKQVANLITPMRNLEIEIADSFHRKPNFAAPFNAIAHDALVADDTNDEIIDYMNTHLIEIAIAFKYGYEVEDD